MADSSDRPKVGDESEIRAALASRDPVRLARAAGDGNGALKAAEASSMPARKQRTSRRWIFIASAGLVGWLALFGVALNVIQMYANHKQYDESRAADQQRWQLEFQRSQEAE